ncbi:MAG: hypothetical protein ACI8TQ_002331 [Planctomycetota bacterium]|jgi:hypothetical protein
MDRLRAWLSELATRAGEVRETFVDETVRHEQAFILELLDGPVLVYAMEAVDFVQGKAAYASSTHVIDAEHRSAMSECLGERVEPELLYDVAL